VRATTPGQLPGQLLYTTTPLYNTTTLLLHNKFEMMYVGVLCYTGYRMSDCVASGK
jgi:hypothetical protein